MCPISVVLADANRNRHKECERLLRNVPHLRLVAQTVHCGDVLPTVSRYKPRMLVLGLSLCGEDSGELVSELLAQSPQTRVVLLERHADQEEEALRALLNGARAYLSHDTLEQQLCRALNGVNKGEAWVPRKMLGRILDWAVDGRVRDGMGDHP